MAAVATVLSAVCGISNALQGGGRIDCLLPVSRFPTPLRSALNIGKVARQFVSRAFASIYPDTITTELATSG